MKPSQLHAYTVSKYELVACDVRVGSWPYECEAKTKRPFDTVYICHTHNTWWHCGPPLNPEPIPFAPDDND